MLLWLWRSAETANLCWLVEHPAREMACACMEPDAGALSAWFLGNMLLALLEQPRSSHRSLGTTHCAWRRILGIPILFQTKWMDFPRLRDFLGAASLIFSAAAGDSTARLIHRGFAPAPHADRSRRAKF